MKKEIEISTKYIILMVLIFVFIVLIASTYFIRNYVKYKQEIQLLITKEVKGNITALKNENRGSYYIEIEDLHTKYRLHSLPIAWEIKKYNIQVGDSVSKDANSRIMTFYKMKKGVFEKYFELKWAITH